MSGKQFLTGDNLTAALNMLEDVVSIFEKQNIKYVLTAGTLLGIVRENRLLPWDRDLDCKVFYEEIKKILLALKQIKKSGYILRFRYEDRDYATLKKGNPRLIKIYNRKYLIFKGGVVMDVFIASKSKDKSIISLGGLKKYTIQETPQYFYDDLDTITFNNKSYTIPRLKDEYLKLHYGDWKTPVKSWSFAKNDGTIVYTEHINKKEIKEMKELYKIKRKW